jgi:hypothetical protein
MKPIVVALAALAGSASTGASQAASIARRVDAVRDGVISMRFASVPNVCGDGSGSTWTRNGSKDSWRGCVTGPVHVVIGRADNTTVSVRTTIGDARRSSDTDLGTVSAPEAARYLLEIAHSLGGRNASEAVSAAALADSVNLSSELTSLVQDAGAAVDTRQQALFWLGQTRIPTSDLSRLYEGLKPTGLREHFVFVMSQRRDETAVDKLIDIASHDTDRDIRKNAMFWLGQTNNPRAVKFLRDLVTR